GRANRNPALLCLQDASVFERGDKYVLSKPLHVADDYHVAGAYCDLGPRRGAAVERPNQGIRCTDSERAAARSGGCSRWALWTTEQGANKLGRLNPDTGQFKEYPLKTPNSGPHGLTADKDGNIWFTAISGGY